LQPDLQNKQRYHSGESTLSLQAAYHSENSSEWGLQKNMFL